MQRLLLLTVLAERHDAVELLVVLTARLTAELVDFVLDNETHTHYLHVFAYVTDRKKCKVSQQPCTIILSYF